MQITIEVNNRKIKAEKGETILSALNRNGILIPTLCRMRDFTPTGACRMCVVEVEGRDRLVTACSQPVEEWMRIMTHSQRVIRSRKTIVELLLSNHPDDCLYCNRNLNCELQRLAEELNINERRIRGKKIQMRLDQSSHSVVRELSKCILCGRCIRVCDEIVTATTLGFLNRGKTAHVGTAMDRDFNFSSCLNCGQCILVCPTGALHEKHNTTEVMESLNRDNVTNVICYSPAVPCAVAEIMGLKYSKEFDLVLNAVLRQIGFDKVYNCGFATDLYIDKAARSLYSSVKEGRRETTYLSACPAWLKYAEQKLPGEIGSLSTLKIPQQIAGAIVKGVVAEDISGGNSEIFTVSVTPCTGMKFESRRDGMTRKGVSDIDAVITVTELSRLIRLFGVDITSPSGEPADAPMNIRSSSALLTEVSGGYTEAIVRSLMHLSGSGEPEKKIFRKLRNNHGFRDLSLAIGDEQYSFAIVDGLHSLERLNAEISGGKSYDIVEVMVCPSGCVHGGGLAFFSSKEVLRTRARQIYATEESEAVNTASRSPALLSFYEEYGDFSDERGEILHTKYNARDVLL